MSLLLAGLPAAAQAPAPASASAAAASDPPSASTAGPVVAASPALLALPAWSEARRALAEFLPEIAAERLQPLLDAPVPGLAAADLEVVRLLLVEAQVRSGRFAQALELLDAAPLPSGSAGFWKVQALLGLGRWQAALDLASSRLEAEPAAAERPWLELAAATARRQLGSGAESLDTLEQLATGAAAARLRQLARDLAIRIALDAGQHDRARRLLGAPAAAAAPRLAIQRARLLLAEGDPAAAEAELRPLVSSAGEDEARPAAGTPGLDPATEAAAMLQLSRCLAARHRPEEAIAELTTYLDTHPLSPLIEGQVALLAELGWHRQRPVPALLRSWSENSAPALRRGATWLLARRALDQGERERAATLLRGLVGFGQAPEFARAARLELAILAAEDGDALRLEQLLGAIASGPDRDEALLATCLQARLALADGNGARARQLLLDACADQDQPGRELLLYNAGQTALLAAQPTEFRVSVKQLDTAGAGADANQLRRDALAHALDSADAGAIREALDDLLAHEDRPALRAEAVSSWCAWALSQPADAVDVDTLDATLAQLDRAQLDATTRARLDEFAFWAALRRPDSAPAREALDAFAARYPDNARLGILRLHLAENLYNDGDYAGALLQYDRFAADLPEDPSAPAASYGAALATLQLPTTDALRSAAQRFAAIAADADSPFRLDAISGQAQALRRLGEDAAALLALDQALDQDGWTAADLAALRCQQAEVRAALDPGSAEAAASWRALIDDPRLPLFWRERAAFDLGAQQERLGQPEVALELYRRVVLGLAGEPEPDPEHYLACARAGLRLLEAAGRWQAAAALADHAAAALDGELAREFTERAEEIRLRHFVEE